MLLLSCRNIKKEFGELSVLKDINIDIIKDEKIGLVGLNGCGKTTFASIIFGELESDSGTIIEHKDNLKIGYLRQSTSYTVNEFTSLFNHGDYRTGDFLKVSSYLGLDNLQNWKEERFDGLSGGEKTKLALTNIWVSQPDLLILDEPTNHLDFQGVEWLIKEIKKYHGAALIISHDRYFLDQVVDKTVELEDGVLNEYNGNYTYYRQEKEKEYQVQLHQYQELKKEERKIENQIKQVKNWSDKAHREARKNAIETGNKFGGKEHNRAKAKKMDQQVASKKKRLLKLKKGDIEKPDEKPDIYFNFTDPTKRGKRLIEAREIKKTYPGITLFEESSFYIQHGDRICLFGENGCGKTTLLKLIMGKEELDAGKLWVSPTLKKGYLSQDVMDLDPNKTSLDNLESDNTRVRTLLANMGFDDNMFEKPVKMLSLGERTRVKIADLILQESDCLILDEPTNHLDLYSREQLEETLDQYNGTIIIVSHDRYLLEKICDSVLIFDDKEVKRIERNFRDYWQNKDKQNIRTEKDKKAKEEMMIIQNRISAILTEIERYDPDDPEYNQLDKEFLELTKRKNKLKN